MSITKTLGGDRLGSGKKMKVELHNYERSTFDLGYITRTTMSAGTLVPFLNKVMLPGDTWDINLDCDIKTHPTIGPLFGSFKVQLDVFLCPIRLYNSWLHNNKLGIGRKMSQVKFPIFELVGEPNPTVAPDDLDNSQVNPSSLLAYLGVRGIGFNGTVSTPTARSFNAIPHLAYWEIYKNYYANKQEEIGAFIHTAFPALVQTVDDLDIDGNQPPQTSPTNWMGPLQQNSTLVINFTGATPIPEQIFLNTTNGLIPVTMLFSNSVTTAGAITFSTYNWFQFGALMYNYWDYQTNVQSVTVGPTVATFPLDWIDEQREDLLATPGNVPFDILAINKFPYNGYLEKNNGFSSYLASQEGLAVKTYQSDLFNNWLSTDWIDGVDGVNTLTRIDTSGGYFNLDTLNLSKKVYNMLNRIVVSGGSYKDWQEAVYAHKNFSQIESPMYMGGLIKELVFQEVVSNSEAGSDAGQQPLGTLAGKGIMSRKHKGGSVYVKADEPSYVIGIISLTPRIDYSQGNEWDVHLKTMDDLYKPELGQIGFQELITEQMAWWSTQYNAGTQEYETFSAGKQPAWINYMTSTNKTFGNFAIPTNEMFMTLNRRYEQDNGSPNNMGDLTTYIDPVKFNQIFAQTALDAQNFWAQIAVDITARRKMSSKVMPNL